MRVMCAMGILENINEWEIFVHENTHEPFLMDYDFMEFSSQNTGMNNELYSMTWVSIV